MLLQEIDTVHGEIRWVLLAYGEVHDVDAYRGQRVIEAISQFMISP